MNSATLGGVRLTNEELGYLVRMKKHLHNNAQLNPPKLLVIDQEGVEKLRAIIDKCFDHQGIPK